MFAELPDAFVGTEPVDQQGGVFVHHVGDLTGPRSLGDRLTLEGGGQLAEQPRSTEAAPTDDHPVAACPAHHCQRVVGFPNVAVAEHGDGGNRFFQSGDGGPVGCAGVELGYCSSVQSHCGHSAVLGDSAGVKVGDVVVIQAHSHLDRHRDRPGGLHRRRHHRFEQAAFVWQCSSASVAGDFAHGASEVQVEMVYAVLADEALNRSLHVVGVDAGQLEAPWRFVGGEAGQMIGLGVAFAQCPGRDHLAHIQSGTEPATQATERGVGHPGHGGQHDGNGDVDRPDTQRGVGRRRRVGRESATECGYSGHFYQGTDLQRAVAWPVW